MDSGDVFIKYEDLKFCLNEGDNVDTTYNIVFFGPHGAGKTDLIDILFNQVILPLKRSAFGGCKFIEGTYTTGKEKHNQEMRRRIRVVDTIGLSGEDLDSQQIININEDSLRNNLNFVDKVVVMANEKIEGKQIESIRKVLKVNNSEANIV